MTRSRASTAIGFQNRNGKVFGGRAESLKDAGRMKRLLLALALLSAVPAFAKPPRLTVFISVDSMGTDIFQRMKPRLHSGLFQLSSQGAFFPALRYEYA